MILLLVFAFSILAFAYVSVTAMLDAQTGARHVQRISVEQMLIQHAAVSRHCSAPGSDCAGTVPSSAFDGELPEWRRGQGSFGDGTMASTVVVLPTGRRYVVSFMSGTDPRIRERFGGMNSAMLEGDLGGSSLWKAAMSSTPGSRQLEMRGTGVRVQDVSGTVTSISHALVAGGTTIPNGSPVLISPISSTAGEAPPEIVAPM